MKLLPIKPQPPVTRSRIGVRYLAARHSARYDFSDRRRRRKKRPQNGFDRPSPVGNNAAMKHRFLPTVLVLLGAATLLTPAAFAKDKKKNKDPEPQSNLDANGVDRNPELHNYAPPPQQYQQVRIKIENKTGQAVGVFYVSPRGSLENLTEVPADGKKHEIASLPGQTWLFKIGRQVIQQYQATAEPKQSITVGGGGGGGGYAPPPAPYPVYPAEPPPPRYVGRGGFAPEVGARAAFLRVHNDARAQVRVAPLRWDPDCAAAAQDWADQLAQRDRGLVHSGNPQYGENVWAGSGRDFSPADAASAWLSERRNYDGGPFDQSNINAGHYTQMVWSRTTGVGYGIARSARGTIYIVADYAPPGNLLGQRPYGR